MRQMPQVFVLGIIGFAVDLQRNVMCLRIVNLFLTGFDVPFPPRRNDRHIRCKMLDGKLKPDLIVSFSSAAVRNCIRALSQRNFHNPLCDHRTRKRGAEHIFLIQRSCLYGRNDIVIYKGIGQILDIKLGCARLQRLFLQPLQLVVLPDIRRNGNDFTVVIIFLQPRNDNRSIQTAGICQNNLFDLALVHDEVLRNALNFYSFTMNK